MYLIKVIFINSCKFHPYIITEDPDVLLLCSHKVLIQSKIHTQIYK